MGDVIDMADWHPHLAGEVVCLACGHLWAAVIRVGEINLECPECSAYQGVMRGQVMPDQFRVCSCGNSLFFLADDGVTICRACGLELAQWYEWDDDD